jgi:hypothetical protein
VVSNRRFRTTYRPHLHGSSCPRRLINFSRSTQKMEPTRRSETSTNKHNTPGNNIKTGIHHSDHGESLKYRLCWGINHVKRLISSCLKRADAPPPPLGAPRRPCIGSVVSLRWNFDNVHRVNWLPSPETSLWLRRRCCDPAPSLSPGTSSFPRARLLSCQQPTVFRRVRVCNY